MTTELGIGPANRKLLNPNFENDTVYLYQFPRAACIPSPSPFVLKLETYLRIAKIKYQSITAKFPQQTSHEKKIPFIELNGREYADSAFIINMLQEKFDIKLESKLKEDDRAIAIAMESLMEDRLVWIVAYDRIKQYNVFMSPKMWGNIWDDRPSLLRPIMRKFAERLINKTLNKQGIGRHTQEEVDFLGKQALKALSSHLGKKKYWTGDKVTKYDAGAFGVLAQIVYALPENELTKYMKSDECKNLVDYVERIKAEFWADWVDFLYTKPQPAQQLTHAK